MYRKFLAYALGEIDPHLNDTRDEGEPRLLYVRSALTDATLSSGLTNLCDPAANDGLGSLLLGQSTSSDRKQTLLQTLFDEESVTKPTVALVAQRVKALTIEEADALDEFNRASCIPIRRSQLVALPSEREDQPLVNPKVIVSFKHFANSHIPRLFLERLSPKMIGIECFSNTNKHARGLTAEIAESTMKLLFAFASDELDVTIRIRQPADEAEVPEYIQFRLAAHAQYRLRLHALVTAAAPPDTSRPLAFENARYYLLRNTEKYRRPRMIVKCFLHATSGLCLCEAHQLKSMAERFPRDKFTGRSQIIISYEMCAERLHENKCYLHQLNCRRHDYCQNSCCACCEISISCRHEITKDGKPEYVEAMRVNCERLDEFTFMEATTIMGHLAKYIRSLKKISSLNVTQKEKRSKLKDTLYYIERMLEHSMDEIDRLETNQQPAFDRVELLRMDAMAVRLLSSGGVIQVPHGVDKNPRLARKDGGIPLTTDEKALSKFPHFRFFPTSLRDAKRPTRSDSLEQLHHPMAENEIDLAQASPALLDNPQLKRPKTPKTKTRKQSESPFDVEMTEFIDVEGLEAMRDAITDKLGKLDISDKARDKGTFMMHYLSAFEQEAGKATNGPLGRRVLPLTCRYRNRNEGGRLYAIGKTVATTYKDGEARTVAVQSANREIRWFLCGRFARDFDLANCQPEILRQMNQQLTWADKRPVAPMPQLTAWCTDRQAFINHVAEVHALPSDAHRWPDYQKDIVKQLMIRLMFGGTYDAWIKDNGGDPTLPPKSPLVTKLARELAKLREDVFASDQWKDFVARDLARLDKEGKKETKEEMARSTFARIAQSEENRVLTTMREFITQQGFQVMTLCFDGLMVIERPGHALDLDALNAFIHRKSGYILKVIEKPLFLETGWPPLQLNR